MKKFTKECQFTSHNKYTCTSERYHRYLERLPIMNGSLIVPRNAKLLFFGTSMVGQLVDVLLCANNITYAVDHRTFSHIQNRFTYSNKNLLPKLCKPSCTTHEYATFYVRDDASIMSVVNWPPLQRFSAIHNFTHFLKTNTFTHVFFMIPHKECFFDWLNNKHKPFCIHTGHNYIPQKIYIQQYSNVLKHTLNTKQIHTKYNILLPWNQLLHQHETHPIHTRHIITQYGPCNTPTCTHHYYHQCIPAPIQFIIQHILQYIG